MVLNRQLGLIVLIALFLSGCQTLRQNTDDSSATLNSPEEDAPRFVKKTNSKPWKTELQASPSITAEPQEPKAPVADLWQVTRDNMVLPGPTDEADKATIQSRIDWYSEHDHYLDLVATRASLYYHYILNEVIDRDMPAEIALLPAIESSYDPRVKSPASATGAWQFMPRTGDHFGLKRNWWYDGRRDIIDSTQAALTYLNYLHDYFDEDWLLALAAYNAGEGTVGRAIKKNKKAGKPTDFWNLDLPKETKAYVPKLLAISEVFKNPENYNLSLNYLPDQPYFEIVETAGQIDIARAAELSGVDVDEIYQLNPGFNRWATDPEGPHRLLMPIARADNFRQQLAKADLSEQMSWARYEVKSGDTLLAIAQRYNVSVDSIRSTNDINTNLIRSGQSLLIPSALINTDQYTLSSNERTERRINKKAPEGSVRRTHEVASGDSLWTIARQYGLDTQQIAGWNEIQTEDTLSIGMQLVLYVEDSESPDTVRGSAKDATQYLVQKGDNLGLIALAHQVSIEELMRWNSLTLDSLLTPGQQLQIAPNPENS